MLNRRQLLASSAASAAALAVAGLPTTASAVGPRPRHTFRDLGATPAVIDVQRLTIANRNYRTAAWTNDSLQLTFMSIPVGGDVGLEIHHDVDQFFRVEAGSALVTMGSETSLDYVKKAGAGDAVLIPSGTWHNIINVGSTPLKLYSLYGPQQHPYGTVHVTKPDEGPAPSIPVGPVSPVKPFTGDVGCTPYVFDVEQATVDNTYYRRSAWTCDTLQLTLMSIRSGGDVGLEMHADVDQFLRVEEGRAKVYFGTSKDGIKLAAIAKPGDAILVPSGTWHNIVNATRCDLKLYSLYGPQQHPFNTVQPTKPLGD